IFCTTSSVISIALVIETPASKREDMVRAVRAVFNSFAILPMMGSLKIIKSIYFAINLERKRKYMQKATVTILTKVNVKLFEKKLPSQTIMRVDMGKTTPSSLKVPARVGTTKANIKTPITTMAE